jgi:hypothetical protein
MMDFDDSDKDNAYFQRAIDEWQKESDRVKELCERRKLHSERRQLNMTKSNTTSSFWEWTELISSYQKGGVFSLKRELENEDITSPGMWVSVWLNEDIAIEAY